MYTHFFIIIIFINKSNITIRKWKESRGNRREQRATRLSARGDEAFVDIRRIVLVLFICREAPLSKHFIIYILYKTRRSEVIVILKMAKRHRRRRQQQRQQRWRRDESSAFTHYIIYNNGNNFISRYALRTPEWAEYVIWARDTSSTPSTSNRWLKWIYGIVNAPPSTVLLCWFSVPYVHTKVIDVSRMEQASYLENNNKHYGKRAKSVCHWNRNIENKMCAKAQGRWVYTQAETEREKGNKCV